MRDIVKHAAHEREVLIKPVSFDGTYQTPEAPHGVTPTVFGGPLGPSAERSRQSRRRPLVKVENGTEGFALVHVSPRNLQTGTLRYGVVVWGEGEQRGNCLDNLLDNLLDCHRSFPFSFLS